MFTYSRCIVCHDKCELVFNFNYSDVNALDLPRCDNVRECGTCVGIMFIYLLYRATKAFKKTKN